MDIESIMFRGFEIPLLFVGCLPWELSCVPVILPRLVLVSLLISNQDTTDLDFGVDIQAALHRYLEPSISYVQFLLSSAISSLFLHNPKS